MRLKKQATEERSMGSQDKTGRNLLWFSSILSILSPISYFNCLINLSWLLQTHKRNSTDFFLIFQINFSNIISQLFNKLYHYFGNISSRLLHLQAQSFSPSAKADVSKQHHTGIFSDMKQSYLSNAILALTSSGYVKNYFIWLWCTAVY